MPITVSVTAAGTVDLETPANNSIAPLAGTDRFVALLVSAYRASSNSRNISNGVLNLINSDMDQSASNSSPAHTGIVGWKESSIVSAGAGGAVDITWAPTDDMAHDGQCSVVEVQGVDQTNYLAASSNLAGTSITSVALPSFSYTTGDLILVAFIYGSGADITHNLVGYTNIFNAQVSMNASNRRVRHWYKIATSDGSESLTFTLGGTNSGAASAVVLKAASAASITPTITTTTLNAMIVGAAFNQTLSADGTPPLTWSVSAGTIPPNLSLNPSTGAITGTPTTAAAYNFTVQATNSAGNDTQVYTGNVVAPKQTITVAGLPKPANSYSVLDQLSYPPANGDTIECDLKTSLGADITMRTDGTFIVNASSGTHVFACRVRSVALGNVWSNTFNVTAKPS